MSGSLWRSRLGDVVTKCAGGKYFPISSEEGGLVWQPAEWLRFNSILVLTMVKRRGSCSCA